MTEQDLHMRCYTWFHNTYSEFRGLLNYNNNNASSKRQGGINKALGLQKGRSDLTLYFQGQVFHIELKTAKGSQSKDQAKWEALIKSHGFSYVVVRTEKEFKKYIISIVGKGVKRKF